MVLPTPFPLFTITFLFPPPNGEHPPRFWVTMVLFTPLPLSRMTFRLPWAEAVWVEANRPRTATLAARRSLRTVNILEGLLRRNVERRVGVFVCRPFHPEDA
jgi:hypothetical protein